MYIKHRTLQMVHEIEKIQHKKNFKTIALKLMSVGVRRYNSHCLGPLNR